MRDRTLVLARASFFRRLLLACFLGIITSAASCDRETLFQSNFDSTDFDQPPSPTQGVGTAQISGGAGSVLVAAAPNADSSPPTKWLKLSRPDAQADFPNFKAKLSKVAGEGTHVFSSALVVPEGNTGPVTILFENVSGEVFFHLDFLPSGKVRIDDDPNAIFGSFELKKPFLVQVTFNVHGNVASTANVVLSGATASGQADRTIISAFQIRSREFAAVEFGIGFPNLGTFHVSTVAVTRSK